jgi:thioredoxin reductase
MRHYDRIIIGAGLYGLYSALSWGRRGLDVLVLECDGGPLSRGSYVN